MSIKTVEITSIRELEVVLTKIAKEKGMSSDKTKLFLELSMKFFTYGVQFNSNQNKVRIEI